MLDHLLHVSVIPAHSSLGASGTARHAKRLVFYKKLKKRQLWYDGLTGRNSPLQAAWYIGISDTFVGRAYSIPGTPEYFV